MRKLAIILNRGNTVQYFEEKPIISYTIEAVKASNLFDEIMVDTTCNETAGIAIQCGANVPFIKTESKEGEEDITTSLLNILHNYQQRGIQFKYACGIIEKLPAVSKFRLNASYNKLKNEQLDSVVPIIPFKAPIQQALIMKEEKIRMVQPKFSHQTEFPFNTYYDSKRFYWINVASFLKQKSLLMEHTGAIILPSSDETHHPLNVYSHFI